MQKVIILFLTVCLFSCKKETGNNAYPLGETNWTLYFKNNMTFTFYAQSHIYFSADKKIQNYRSADTITGNWQTKSKAVTINFDNGDIYTGAVITNDSISGTLTASGNNGLWYAIKR